ncbi:hypothetical protein DV736_g5554, partial [Chaetothyriales sp. CBS 134916]
MTSKAQKKLKKRRKLDPHEEITASRAWDKEITENITADKVTNDQELAKALDDEIEVTDNYITTPPPENTYSVYKIINNEARFTDFQPTQARRVLFKYLETAQMPADGFTKALPRQKYGEFVKLIKMTNITLRLQQERRMEELRDKIKARRTEQVVGEVYIAFGRAHNLRLLPQALTDLDLES